MLEDTYLKLLQQKTAELFSASTKVGAILAEVDDKKKRCTRNFYGRKSWD